MRRLYLLVLCCWPIAVLAETGSRVPDVASPAAMTFTLTQGETGACGPGCSRWIAAEGAILAATPVAFREVSQALGGEKPPLLIHSDGGTVEAAMALGRQVRSAGLSTVIARTDRSGSLPAPALDGQCHGACLYLLLAGTERAMAPGAELSISPIAFGGPAAETLPDALRQRLVAGVLVRVRAYLGEMGIDPELATYLDGERYEGFFPGRGFLDRHAILTRDP